MISSKGVPSSKRMVTIIAFILMATGFIANLFFNFVIDEFIYRSVELIVIAGLGFTASEQFARGGTVITSKIGKDAPALNDGPRRGGHGGYYDNDDDYEPYGYNRYGNNTPPRRGGNPKNNNSDEQYDNHPAQPIEPAPED